MPDATINTSRGSDANCLWMVAMYIFGAEYHVLQLEHYAIDVIAEPCCDGDSLVSVWTYPIITEAFRMLDKDDGLLRLFADIICYGSDDNRFFQNARFKDWPAELLYKVMQRFPSGFHGYDPNEKEVGIWSEPYKSCQHGQRLLNCRRICEGQRTRSPISTQMIPRGSGF